MSKLLRHPLLSENVVIGEYRVDLEADRTAEKKLATRFTDVKVITSVEGRKLIPIQEILKVEQRLNTEKEAEHRRGYDEGYRKGLAEGHKEAQRVIDNFSSLVNDAVKQREVLYFEARAKILELVIKIAEKVTFGAVRVDPELTATIISGAIGRLVDKTHIKVKVHPDHLPLIEQQIERFKGDSAAIKELVIESDARVRHGGCFIETPTGDVDARVESQIGIVAEALNEIEATV